MRIKSCGAPGCFGQHEIVKRGISAWFFRILVPLAMLCAADGPKSSARAVADSGAAADALEAGFPAPPASARPWVFWFWINGNISKEGITADLEAMQRRRHRRRAVDGSQRAVVGAGRAGRRRSARSGTTPSSGRCANASGWASSSTCRWISATAAAGRTSRPNSPCRSSYWSETEVEGGRPVDADVGQAGRSTKNLSAWLRPGAEIDPEGPRGDREDRFLPGRGRAGRSRAGIAEARELPHSATSMPEGRAQPRGAAADERRRAAARRGDCRRTR